MQRKQFAPRHADPMDENIGRKKEEDDESESDEEEEFDLVEVMQDMPIHERRKVYALKGLLNDYKAVRAMFREELALLQIQHLEDVSGLHKVRKEIVCGDREITEEEIKQIQADLESRVEEVPSEDDDGNKKAKKSVRVMAPEEEKQLKNAEKAADGGIPNFWLTAMEHTEALGSMITERDRGALSFLKDVTMSYVEGDPQKGVILDFHFAPNEYFENKVLSKTYAMSFDEDSGEVEIDSLKGTPIVWTSPQKNLTVIIKVKKQRNQKTHNIRLVKREEKCPSFFNFFNDIADDEDEEEEEDEDMEAEAEFHLEAGQIFMEELIPKAAFYYTGKSVDEVAQALEGQLDISFTNPEDEEEEEEEEERPALGRGRRGH